MIKLSRSKIELLFDCQRCSSSRGGQGFYAGKGIVIVEGKKGSKPPI